MSRAFTVGIVGCGIGRSHVREGILTQKEKFRLLAVCDLDAERLAAFAAEFDVPRQTTRFDDLLAMDDLDIIDICTPPMVHKEQILKALAAGKHVICEKPLVGSLADIDEIIAAEADAKGRLMPILQYRYGEGVQQAKAIIDAGIAGKPYVGTAETLWLRGADYYSGPWRGTWAGELGGVLMTHSLHIHDLFLFLMGPVERLFGRVATRVNDIEVEDCVSASCLMQSGALASLTATLGSHEQISRIRLAFENVTFESGHSPYEPGTRPWRIIPASPEVDVRIQALLRGRRPVAPRFEGQFAALYQALAAGGPLPVTTADARRALELVTAFYHSAETRTDVTLPIGRENPKYGGWVPEGA
ncbi:MAG TPA: Gfo/Idh/MocA family oxidoreductase [Devosiaceae bacterium]|nr:Gfo/Idh/MocA family oxidoreductase [Devosiaceae bacterium]